MSFEDRLENYRYKVIIPNPSPPLPSPTLPYPPSVKGEL